MRTLKLSVAAAAVLATASTFAATDATTTEPTRDQQIEQVFMKMDSNRDGLIDASEAQANKSLQAAFARVATTGKLGKQEFMSWYRSYDMVPAEE